MKKLFFLCTFLISSILPAQSAVSKGTYTIGGNINYSSTSNSSSTFTANPSFGYFIIDNFYTAVSLSYEHSSYSSTKFDMYGFGPSIRYYAHTDGVVPFLGASFNYLWEKYSTVGYDKITVTQLKFAGGLSYFVTEYFAVESTINYSFMNYNYPPGLYIGVSKDAAQFEIGVGASYYIH